MTKMDKLKIKNGVLTAGGRSVTLRGFGLGGWLLPEGYMWLFYTKCDRPRRIEALIRELCGDAYAEGFWQKYYDRYITEEDIRYISAHGFNSIRLPFNARHLEEPNYLKHIDDCVDWCEKHGVYAVLDMHAAPGGQTGQNIDDSVRDIPELFTCVENQKKLAELWRALARRYAGREAVAGFDLLNEPILKKDSQHAHKLVPLYIQLTEIIRREDPDRIVIWEGMHWATDFSVFNKLTTKDMPEGVMLQFHKYWSPPDRESLECFFEAAKRLNVPLYCGESGENNLEWYTTLFPMLDAHHISWSFWSYKKMQTPNSISVFPKPKRWEDLIRYLDGGQRPDDPIEIFDGFLDCLTHGSFHEEIIHALNRTAPVLIPCEAFSSVSSKHPRTPGVVFRMDEGAQLVYADGHVGEPDCRRYGGEPRPDSERMFLRLRPGESVSYVLNETDAVKIKLNGQGDGVLNINGTIATLESFRDGLTLAASGEISVTCLDGDIYLENLEAAPCV